MGFYIILTHPLRGFRFVCVKNDCYFQHKSPKNVHRFETLKDARTAAVPYGHSWGVHIVDESLMANLPTGIQPAAWAMRRRR